MKWCIRKLQNRGPMQILARWASICSSFNRIRVVEYRVLEPDLIYLNCTDRSWVTPDLHQHKQDQNQSHGTIPYRYAYNERMKKREELHTRQTHQPRRIPGLNYLLYDNCQSSGKTAAGYAQIRTIMKNISLPQRTYKVSVWGKVNVY